MHVHRSTERVNPTNSKFQPAVAGKFRGRLFCRAKSSGKESDFSQGFAQGQVYDLMKAVFKILRETLPTGTPLKHTTHIMKTKSIATLLTAALTIAFAASASASPPGKGPLKSSFKRSAAPKVERKVEHKSMHYVGPPGKGYICTH